MNTITIDVDADVRVFNQDEVKSGFECDYCKLASLTHDDYCPNCNQDEFSECNVAVSSRVICIDYVRVNYVDGEWLARVA